MDSAIVVVLLLIVCFLILGGGWFLIMRTEMKIEKKMHTEFELKREEEKQQKILQKYEELLAMEDGCRRRAAERYPLLPQLQYQQDQAPERDRDRAFLI